MKSVLISIQPYWTFLIIAKLMGWEINRNKTIEVRKNFPKAEDWNKLVKIYCSKDKNSFNLIPKEYQPLMQKFLGKLIGEFVCDRMDKYVLTLCDGDNYHRIEDYYSPLREACLTQDEIVGYGNGKTLYGWHISDLKIYDKPKELSEFKKHCHSFGVCFKCEDNVYWGGKCDGGCIERPPQSWCYVEE